MAITYAQKPKQDIEKSPVTYLLLSTDTKPTAASHDGLPEPTAGSVAYEHDTGLWKITHDGTTWVTLKNAGGAGLVSKTSSSPLTTGTLFTVAGSFEIIEIIGRVTTVIQGQATTVKLSMTMDALAAVDICATKDINAFAVGTMLHIDGTFADAMIGATGVAVAVAQTGAIKATCITSGTITVTYGAASTGAIVWEVLWIPLSPIGSIVAA